MLHTLYDHPTCAIPPPYGRQSGARSGSGQHLCASFSNRSKCTRTLGPIGPLGLAPEVHLHGGRQDYPHLTVPGIPDLSTYTGKSQNKKWRHPLPKTSTRWHFVHSVYPVPTQDLAWGLVMATVPNLPSTCLVS